MIVHIQSLRRGAAESSDGNDIEETETHNTPLDIVGKELGRSEHMSQERLQQSA